MVAETCTFPFDISKTRLQLHRHTLSSSSSSSSSSSITAFKVVSKIVHHEGPLSFYNGLSPAILCHLFCTPIRIVSYKYLRNVFSADSTQSPSLSADFYSRLGGCKPVDLVKVRMQADGRLVRQGLQPRYSRVFDVLSKTIRAEGIVGLWRRVFPNIQWAFLVNRENWLAMIMQIVLLSKLFM
ncbi:Mitochondrial substrate/solute carrier [Dillenia turbinata]|uniref:Mitochondrial substrate/solute carrier n=1 Tax=Dillenia turbinata TaxID=194707 RepID=A0AAN8UZ16_9MAGN